MEIISKVEEEITFAIKFYISQMNLYNAHIITL